MLSWLCWSLDPSAHTHSLYWALTQWEKSANIWHLCTPFQYFPDFFGIGVIKISNFGKLGKNYLVISHCDDTQWLPMTRHLGCFLSVSIRSRTQFWECCSILLLLYLSLISWRVATLVYAREIHVYTREIHVLQTWEWSSYVGHPQKPLFWPLT